MERGGALFLTVAVIYILLAPTTVVDGDNAELSTVGAIGGRAHPSGYPAYVLILRLTSWIPGASPAHTAAIATAILGALAVLALQAACRAWGARPLAASIAAAMYAAGPIVLRTHTEAEVFALNALVVALILWLAAQRGPARGNWRVGLLALVAGLGLSNHLTCVLVLPVGLLGAVRGVRESNRATLAISAGIAALAIGLLPYVYLIVADGPTSWGYIDSAGDLWAFFTRKTYGGAGAFMGNGEVDLGGQLALFAVSTARTYVLGFAILGIAMLGLSAVRGRDNIECVWGWRMLAISWLVAGPVLASRFNMPLEGFGPYVCRRFHLVPLLMLAIPVAIGIDQVADRIRTRLGFERLAGVGPALVCLLFVALTATSLPRLRAQHSAAMERGTEYLLRSVPDRAIVVGIADDLCFTADYLQHVRGIRPDVTFVCWILTSHDWYRPRIERQGLFFELYTPAISRSQAQLWLATGRPLFVEQSGDGSLKDMPRYPFGVVLHVLPRGSPLPPPLDILEINRKLFGSFDLDYPHPGTDDDWATIVHVRYARAWRDISRLLLASGAQAEAQSAHDVAQAYYPLD